MVKHRDKPVELQPAWFRWRQRHPEQYQVLKLASGKRYRRKLRADALAAYGGKCACCGEATTEFLAIDHINGGGRKHRKAIHAPMELWLRNQGYPEEFRLLCHNCNFSAGFYGYCPHQRAYAAWNGETNGKPV